MHKITPNYNALATHTAGGAYATINEVNDGEGGQMTGGNSPGGQSGMSGEAGGKDRAPQNYGFTSVVADGENIGSGKGTGAEALMSFAGGNRSFPVMGNMDDRRHRLKGLDKVAKGSVGMYGLKEWGQQFLNTKDGMFMTGNMERKIRFALTENKKNQEQQQQGGGQSGGGGAATREGESGGGGGESGGQQGKKKLGQESLHDENKESKIFFDQDKSRTHQGHEDGQAWYDKDMSLGYHKDKDKSYRADKDHSHIAHTTSNSLFTDAGGCFSTKPIQIKADSCSGGSAVRAAVTGYHLASVTAPLVQSQHNVSLDTSDPLEIKDGQLALKLVNPLALDAGGSVMLKYGNPLTVDGSGILQVKHTTPLAIAPGTGNFILKYASPLHLDASGNLTVTITPTDTSGLAPINSPNFTGFPIVPDAELGQNDNQIANCSWVQTEIPNGLMRAVEPLLARIDELQARIATLEARLA